MVLKRGDIMGYVWLLVQTMDAVQHAGNASIIFGHARETSTRWKKITLCCIVTGMAPFGRPCKLIFSADCTCARSGASNLTLTASPSSHPSSSRCIHLSPVHACQRNGKVTGILLPKCVRLTKWRR